MIHQTIHIPMGMPTSSWLIWVASVNSNSFEFQERLLLIAHTYTFKSQWHSLLKREEGGAHRSWWRNNYISLSAEYAKLNEMYALFHLFARTCCFPLCTLLSTVPNCWCDPRALFVDPYGHDFSKICSCKFTYCLKIDTITNIGYSSSDTSL